MPEPDRDARINLLCQLAERGGTRRLLSRDGERLRFGSSKVSHENRMVVGVMVGTLLASMTVPLLFLQGADLLTGALALVAVAMIALVVVPLVGRPPEVTLDLGRRAVTVERGSRAMRRAPLDGASVFFHKAPRGDRDSASVSMRIRGRGRAVLLVDGLDVSSARELRDLLLGVLEPSSDEEE